MHASARLSRRSPEEWGAAVSWLVALVVFLAVFGLVAWGAGRSQRRVSEDQDGARRASAEAERQKWSLGTRD